jgi:hypothetical protein
LEGEKMVDEQDFDNWRGDVENSLYILKEEIKKLDARLKLLENVFKEIIVSKR